MNFLADCPECGGKASTVTVLDGANLDRVLECDGIVEVRCFPRDHRFKLGEQDKANLRNLRKTRLG